MNVRQTWIHELKVAWYDTFLRPSKEHHSKNSTDDNALETRNDAEKNVEEKQEKSADMEQAPVEEKKVLINIH